MESSEPKSKVKIKVKVKATSIPAAIKKLAAVGKRSFRGKHK